MGNRPGNRNPLNRPPEQVAPKPTRIISDDQNLQKIQDNSSRVLQTGSIKPEYRLGVPTNIITGNYRANINDAVRVDLSDGYVDIYLPEITTETIGGLIFISNISNNATNVITVYPALDNTIDGGSILEFYGAYNNATLWASSDSNWSAGKNITTYGTITGVDGYYTGDLYVSGNVIVDGYISCATDGYITGNLYVDGYVDSAEVYADYGLFDTLDVTNDINATDIYISNDAIITRNILAGGDGYIDGNLFVDGYVDAAEVYADYGLFDTLDVVNDINATDIYISNDAIITRNILAGGYIDVTGDGYIGGNLFVDGYVDAAEVFADYGLFDTFDVVNDINATDIYISNDAMINGDLYVDGYIYGDGISLVIVDGYIDSYDGYFNNVYIEDTLNVNSGTVNIDGGVFIDGYLGVSGTSGIFSDGKIVSADEIRTYNRFMQYGTSLINSFEGRLYVVQQFRCFSTGETTSGQFEGGVTIGKSLKAGPPSFGYKHYLYGDTELDDIWADSADIDEITFNTSITSSTGSIDIGSGTLTAYDLSIDTWGGATYTTSNVTTDRAFDADSTTLDEVADVLGTLIADLKLLGLIS